MSTFSNDPIMRRLHACALAQVPSVLWSPPGSGKTARVKAYSAARKSAYERAILSRCEPIDIKPRSIGDDGARVHEMPELTRLRAAGGGILFLDELNRAERSVEGAALDIIDNPPKGVFVVAACNTPTKGQASRSLSSAAANRFCHLTVTSDSDAWARAQLHGWDAETGTFPLPSDPEAEMLPHEQHARALVSAWVPRRAGAFNKEPDNAIAAGKAWPSARTWEYARQVYTVARWLRLDVDDMSALVGGCIGEGNAIEFLQFALDASQVPDPETILQNPENFRPVRDRVDITIVAITGVAQAVERDMTDARWRAAWKVARVCEDYNCPDAGLVLGDLLTKAYKGLGKDAIRAKKISDPAQLVPPRMRKIFTGV